MNEEQKWILRGIGPNNVYIETVSGKPDGGFICDMQADEIDTPEERARMNAYARQVVASPELLEACQAVLNDDIPIGVATQMCRDAEAKATRKGV